MKSDKSTNFAETMANIGGMIRFTTNTRGVNIVGVMHEYDGVNPQEIIPKLKESDEIILEYDPTNKYDHTAVKVKTATGIQIGWIAKNDRIKPSLINAFKNNIDIIAWVSETYELSSYPGNIGLCIEITILDDDIESKESIVNNNQSNEENVVLDFKKPYWKYSSKELRIYSIILKILAVPLFAMSLLLCLVQLVVGLIGCALAIFAWHMANEYKKTAMQKENKINIQKKEGKVMTNKEKKKWYQKWWVWVIIVIIALAAISSSEEDTATTENNSTSVTTQQNENIPENEPEKTEKVSMEYKNALKKAESYSKTMHMSKKAIYEQLTSEYGEKFPADAAQYAIDNLKADFKANALKKAKSYQETMSMSKSAIYDQLVSEYGERFTAEEAQYAVDNLED